MRVGLIGCGGIGGTHLPHYANHPEGELGAACDINWEQATHAASEFGIPAFTDYREMLENAPLDAVDICTPPNTHREIALAAIERGKHVLCEKPLARNSAEGQEMVDAARNANMLLMTAFCHRFHPPIMVAKRLISEGKIGRVLMFRNRFSGKLSGVENRWFSQKETAGGGALIDTAIHSVDLFRHLVGDIKTTMGIAEAFNPAIKEVEDSGVMLLESTDGALGVIEASWATPDAANVVEIYGSEGAIQYSYDTGELRFKNENMPHWTTPTYPAGDRFRNEINHFLWAIGGRTCLCVTGEDGVLALQAIEKVLRH